MQQPTTPSTSSAISPQQERTEPSGPRPCRRGTKSSPRREPDVPGDFLRALFGNVTEPAREPIRQSLQRIVVKDHDLAIQGRSHVAFDGVPSFSRRLGGRNRILDNASRMRVQAAMRDRPRSEPKRRRMETSGSIPSSKTPSISDCGALGQARDADRETPRQAPSPASASPPFATLRIRISTRDRRGSRLWRGRASAPGRRLR